MLSMACCFFTNCLRTGCLIKQWKAAYLATNLCIKHAEKHTINGVSMVGFEPTSIRLKARCSATELHALLSGSNCVFFEDAGTNYIKQPTKIC